MEPNQSAERSNIPFIDLLKFKMFRPPSESGNKNSVLSWGVRDGNPRINVYTGVANDLSNHGGFIHAAFNPETFFILLDELEKVAHGPEKQGCKISCFTTFRKEDGSRGDKVLGCDVYLGKDSKGVVWISLVAENRPKIKFYFQISDWHLVSRITEKGTEPLSEAEASFAQTLAAVKTLRRVYTAFVGTTSSSANNNRDSNRSKYAAEHSNSKPAKVEENDLFDDIEM